MSQSKFSAIIVPRPRVSVISVHYELYPKHRIPQLTILRCKNRFRNILGTAAQHFSLQCSLSDADAPIKRQFVSDVCIAKSGNGTALVAGEPCKASGMK